MARLSLYHDGLALDPLLSYCSGPSLVHKLLNEKIAGSVKEIEDMRSLAASSGSLKRKSDSLSDILMLLKGVAADPCSQMRESQEWQDQILKVRKALFKKQRTHEFLCETFRGTANPSMERPQIELSGRLDSHEMLNQPVRRSQRTSLKLGESHLPRKRIPIGPLFQADVPDWSGPFSKKDESDKDDLNDSRWLGTQIWPVEGDDRQIGSEIIGKGRPDVCACTSPGSMKCIRFHVNMERLHLKSDLGPAFFHLGFGEMGEEVSKLWTHAEQIKFDDLVRLNPVSANMSFWEPALNHFTSKSRQDLVSYYFNVFVLRWMGIRTRLASETTVGSDDDV